MNFKKLLKDNKAQVSLEVLLIVGIVVLAALLVGYYLKQTALKNSTRMKNYQETASSGRI